MRYFFQTIIILISLFLPQAKAQDISKNELPYLLIGADAGFKYSPNGHTFGLIADISKPFYMNKSGKILLSSGFQNDFQLQQERGVKGTSGATIRNSIHLTFGPTFYFLESGKLSSSIKLFGGWSYKSTNGKVENAELGIHRNYKDKYHYFSRGIILQTGYKIKQDYFLSIFFKTDLRRLTDGDGIFEIPEMIYGIGVKKIINKH